MEGDVKKALGFEYVEISIHSLRMEGDYAAELSSHLQLIFQSTPSAWRETIYTLHQMPLIAISIHSLRMEGDGWSLIEDGAYREISIHSLRMEGDILLS